ncbi:hypothetical protein [Pseudomonas brassicacearum]|uniref:hypothetical protein n=1 Tax=Pseudomonas brassicacearum TaxID=930166 RepID=UPI00118290E9|nr:hypothetical protein [Pseudomonas brassicacearum]
MNPNDYVGRPIIGVLAALKDVFPLVEYTKVERDEFLKLPECGVYFQAGSEGVVVAYRVYYQAVGEYYPAAAETKNACFGIATVEDSIAFFGQPVRDIPSVRIPGIAPTSPGYEFLTDGRVVAVHYDSSTRLVTYVHVKKIVKQ